MGTHIRHEYFGQYRLVRPQSAVHGLERWVVLDEQSNSNHMLYRFAPIHDTTARRLFGAVHSLTAVNHAHLLKMESVSFDELGRLCVITPYTGNQDGLVTLSELMAQRDGKLEPVEGIRCLTHLLEASQAGADRGITHGLISADEILVDRFGSVQIELYGLDTVLNHLESSTSRVTDEVRSIVKIAYKMLVGLESGPADRLAPSRMVRKLDKLWDKWFSIGLDPVDGFVSAAAIAKLPTSPNAAEALASHTSARPQVQFGSMLRRFRTAGSRTRARR
jgi:hypothetical protein